MKKMSFGRQGFLNPASSEDSGYYKFSLEKKGETPGRVTVFYRIADCSQSIDLDFGVYGLNEDGLFGAGRIREEIKEIRARRKKMKAFVKVVTEFASRYDTAMEAAEAEMIAMLGSRNG